MKNGDGKNLSPRGDSELGGKTIKTFASDFNVSEHSVKRAISHGLIQTIRFGDRPLIPMREVKRIDREGLPKIPPGYKRKTQGLWPGGRKPKAAATAPARLKSNPKVAAKTPARGRGEDRPAS